MRAILGLLALIGVCNAIGVFPIKSAAGRYQIKNVEEARELCRSYNARLANIEELEISQIMGLDHCECGFLEGGEVALPLVKPRPGCGSSPGIRHCPADPKSWGGVGWDAYCIPVKTVTCPAEFALGPAAKKYRKSSGTTADWAQLYTTLTFPANGKVAAWKFYANRADMQAYAAVYRPVGKDRFQLIGRTKLPVGRVGTVSFVVDDKDQIPVKKGDFIGVHYSSIEPAGNNQNVVIPYAAGSGRDLCAEDGTCLETSDLYLTTVVHRHEEQLFHKKNYVLDLSKIYSREFHTGYKRAPALRATLCADNPADLPNYVTTTEAPETTQETEATTPEEEMTPEPPTEATEPHTEETTTTTTTTTTTEAPTTTTKIVTEAASIEVAQQAPREVPCHLPFTYHKHQIQTCTKLYSDRPWCSTSAVYDGQHWRYCHEGDPFEDLPCHLPFEYNGKQHNMCIKAGSSNYWCATAAVYGPYSWKNCAEGDPIPDELPCHYPFLFEGKQKETCVSHGASKPWCAVEAEYNQENWRYCRDGDRFPEEVPCHLPFDYYGRTVTTCISDNANRPWCSTIAVYDTKSWRYCRQVEIFLLSETRAGSVEEAKQACADSGMKLAMERDATAAYENGSESCVCGWVSSGKALNLVHNPREDCSPDSKPGISECSTSQGAFIPICVKQ